MGLTQISPTPKMSCLKHYSMLVKPLSIVSTFILENVGVHLFVKCMYTLLPYLYLDARIDAPKSIDNNMIVTIIIIVKQQPYCHSSQILSNMNVQCTISP